MQKKSLLDLQAECDRLDRALDEAVKRAGADNHWELLEWPPTVEAAWIARFAAREALQIFAAEK